MLLPIETGFGNHTEFPPIMKACSRAFLPTAPACFQGHTARLQPLSPQSLERSGFQAVLIPVSVSSRGKINFLGTEWCLWPALTRERGEAQTRGQDTGGRWPEALGARRVPVGPGGGVKTPAVLAPTGASNLGTQLRARSVGVLGRNYEPRPIQSNVHVAVDVVSRTRRQNKITKGASVFR